MHGALPTYTMEHAVRGGSEGVSSWSFTRSSKRSFKALLIPSANILRRLYEHEALHGALHEHLHEALHNRLHEALYEAPATQWIGHAVRGSSRGFPHWGLIWKLYTRLCTKLCMGFCTKLCIKLYAKLCILKGKLWSSRSIGTFCGAGSRVAQ